MLQEDEEEQEMKELSLKLVQEKRDSNPHFTALKAGVLPLNYSPILENRSKRWIRTTINGEWTRRATVAPSC